MVLSVLPSTSTAGQGGNLTNENESIKDDPLARYLTGKICSVTPLYIRVQHLKIEKVVPENHLDFPQQEKFQ